MLSEINTEQLISYQKDLENLKLFTLQLMVKKKFLKFLISQNKEELDLPCTTQKRNLLNHVSNMLYKENILYI